MAIQAPQQDPFSTPAAKQPATPDFQKDYWAPDRAAVLQSKGLTDTSGKQYNGSQWFDPSQASANTGVNGGAPAATPAPAGTPAPAPSSAPPNPNTAWDQGSFASSFGSPRNPQELVALEPKLNAAGIKVMRNASGVAGKIQLPNGQIVDVINSAGAGGNGFQWLTGDGGGGSAAGGIPGMGSSYYSGSIGNFSNPRASGLYDMLMGRATQSLNVDPKDPIISRMVGASSAQMQRADRNQLNQQAEAGGPYGNMNMERRMAAEHEGQASGQLQAQLMGNELTARRGEIQNALSQMGGMLTSEQQLGLQQQLGMIDAALRQQGVTNQNNQFLDDLGLRAENQASYWDQARRGY